MDLGLLRVVPMSDITCDHDARGRKAYGVIADLAKLIKDQGLINPVTVYSPNGKPPFTLIAGARRYAACGMLGYTEISCRIYDRPLTEKELLTIEYFENEGRLNLNFVEDTQYKLRLHEKLVELGGIKTARSYEANGHSIRDTARLIGKPHTTVKTDIRLGKAIRDKPELRLDEEKNKSAALKKLKQVEMPKIPVGQIGPQQQIPTGVIHSPQMKGSRSAGISILKQLLKRWEDAPEEELRALIEMLSSTIGE